MRANVGVRATNDAQQLERECMSIAQKRQAEQQVRMSMRVQQKRMCDREEKANLASPSACGAASRIANVAIGATCCESVGVNESRESGSASATADTKHTNEGEADECMC